MTTTTESKKTIQFAVVAALALGAPLDGGTFQGVITLPGGTHVAVALLAEKPDKRLTWADAKAWAEGIDGQLPTRPIAALLYANAKDQFTPDWYWTGDELSADTGNKRDASYAWGCHFSYGNQGSSGKSYAGCARAVRLIHIEG
jgi:hypothetical protein